MTEPGSGEIGPINNAPEASVKRFEARQEFRKSTEGQVVAGARFAEAGLKSEREKAAAEAASTPDVIEKRSIFGIPLATVSRWFKKK